MVVCNKCHAALHIKCYCEEIIDKSDVKDYIDLVKKLLISITDNNKVFREGCFPKNFDSEIDSYQESIKAIDDKVITF